MSDKALQRCVIYTCYCRPIIQVHGRAGFSRVYVVGWVVRVRVEVRRGGYLRQSPILWFLLDGCMWEWLGRKVLEGRTTLVLVVKPNKITLAAFYNYLAQIWAQVLNSLKDLAKETTNKDVYSLLACLIANSIESCSFLILKETLKSIDGVYT